MMPGLRERQPDETCPDCGAMPGRGCSDPIGKSGRSRRLCTSPHLIRDHAPVVTKPEGPMYCRALTPAEQAAFALDFPEFVAPMPPAVCRCPEPRAARKLGICLRCAQPLPLGDPK